MNEFLTRELAEDGYSGVEVRVAPTKTEIIIMATRTQNVLGEKGRRIRELTSVVQKRFNFPENSVELYAEKVATRGLCAIAQAESLRYKLIGGLAVRRACYGVLRFIMESGAKGCEVVVSGKLRGQVSLNHFHEKNFFLQIFETRTNDQQQLNFFELNCFCSGARVILQNQPIQPFKWLT